MEDDLLTQLQALGAEPVAPAPAPVDRAAAEKAFVEESGPVGAAIRGAMSGASFGAAPKMVQAVERFLEALGVLDESSLQELSPQQKQEILRQEFPKAFGIAEAVGSLVAPSPAGKSAAARTLVNSALGAGEAAMRGGSVGDIATGGLLGAAMEQIPVVGKALSRGAKRRGAEVALPSLQKKAKEQTAEFSSLRKAFEPTAEMKAVRKAESAAKSAGKTEKAASQSIFDEPVSGMTMQRAEELQSSLYGARKQKTEAEQALQEAMAAAGETPGMLASAQKRALESQKKFMDAREKLASMPQGIGSQSALAKRIIKTPEFADKLAAAVDMGGRVGGIAAKVLKTPAIVEITADGQPTQEQLDAIALINVLGEMP
jgi:hypothetical protein